MSDGVEVQRRPVPRVDDGELATALAFLGFARDSLLKKLDGLDDDEVRRVLVPTGTNLLGLVRHMVVGERYWFRHHLLGEDDGVDWDFDMAVPREESTESVVAAYRDAIERSNEAIERVGDPSATMARDVDGKQLSLRWVLAHVTSETARHAGHADILREQIDGVTGR